MMLGNPKTAEGSIRKVTQYDEKFVNAQSTLLSLKSKEVTNNSVTLYMNKMIEKKNIADDGNRNRFD